MPSSRRIGKATKPPDLTTLPEPVQALTVAFKIYSLAQASSGYELCNAPCCRIIEDGLRNLLSDSTWTPFDTYFKVACCKLYTTKTSITSADLLNDRVLPLFEDSGMGLLRILTDRGTEFCGKSRAPQLSTLSGHV